MKYLRLQFLGAWILPTGEVHWTNNDETHLKVINDLRLYDFLIDESKKIKWTKEELQRKYNSDVGYIAMRLGYLRVSSFQQQFILEYIKTPISEIQISTLYDVYDDLQGRSDFEFQDFYIEKFIIREYKLVHTRDQFFNAVKELK